MSDFANEIAGAINTIADKVKEYGGYAKFQALIKAEEAKKQEYYYKLGKKYYELYKDAPASDLTDITDKLLAADEKIAELQEQLKEAKENGYTDVTDDVKADEDVETVENLENLDAAPETEAEVSEETEETTEE